MGNRRENRRQRKQPSSRGVPKEGPVIVLLGSQAVGIRQLPAAGITGLPRLQASLYQMDLKKKKDLFIYFQREGKGGRKGGRETSIGYLSHTPNQGPGLQPRHVPWPGIELATFWFAGHHPTH